MFWPKAVAGCLLQLLEALVVSIEVVSSND